MDRKSIIEAIEREKIIVIVRGVVKDKLIPLAEAMYKGGIRLLEITYSADGTVSDEDTSADIEMLAKHFDGRMVIGAGTVLTEKQVELTAKAGGRFIISPDANPEIIKHSIRQGLVSIPGALTPTEIQSAARAGADFVKLFPVMSMGAEYVKAVRAPLSHVKLLAVGGINNRNMREYLNAGAAGFGIGSGIIDKKLLDAGDYDGIAELAKGYAAVIK